MNGKLKVFANTDLTLVMKKVNEFLNRGLYVLSVHPTYASGEYQVFVWYKEITE